MHTKRLGNSDLDITPIGFGAWAIGGAGWAFAWGAQDDGDSIAAIHRALDLGINWIDTAALYGNGVSEAHIGEQLAALDRGEGNEPVVPHPVPGSGLRVALLEQASAERLAEPADDGRPRMEELRWIPANCPPTPACGA